VALIFQHQSEDQDSRQHQVRVEKLHQRILIRDGRGFNRQVVDGRLSREWC
jgi:hypothetical protein